MKPSFIFHFFLVFALNGTAFYCASSAANENSVNAAASRISAIGELIEYANLITEGGYLDNLRLNKIQLSLLELKLDLSILLPGEEASVCDEIEATTSKILYIMKTYNGAGVISNGEFKLRSEFYNLNKEFYLSHYCKQ